MMAYDVAEKHGLSCGFESQLCVVSWVTLNFA